MPIYRITGVPGKNKQKSAASDPPPAQEPAPEPLAAELPPDPPFPPAPPPPQMKRLIPVETKPAGKAKPEKPRPALWQKPGAFPENAPRILQRNHITKRQFSRYMENLGLFLLSNLSGDFAISLQSMIRSKDKGGMELYARCVGLIKNEAALVINQNNLTLGTVTGNDRSFDHIVRLLDDRDRSAAPEFIPVIESADEDEAEDVAIEVEAE